MRQASGVLHVLAVIGFIALSVAVAHAGAGSGGGSNVLFAYQCYFIDGNRPAIDVLNLTDQFGTRENVQVGPGRLVCTPVEGTRPDGGLFDALPPFPDHIKCYTISPWDRGPNGRLRLNNPDAVVDLTDEIDIDRGLQVGIPVLLCTNAQKDCVSGGSCPVP